MSAYWYMELRTAMRALAKRPQFVLTVVVTLALSMATVISIFSLNSLLLLQKLPFKDTQQQYIVELKLDFAGKTFPALPVLQKRLADNQTSFETTSLYIGETRTLELQQQSFKLETAFVSDTFFEQLGLNAMHGRVFNHHEKFNNFAPSTVLSYQLWQDKFSANPAIIGRQVNLDGTFFSVVGVLSKDAISPDNLASEQPQLYLPLDFSKADLLGDKNISEGEATIIAKGATGQSQIFLNEINSLANQLKTGINNPLLSLGTINVNITPLREAIIGESDKLSLLLLSGALMLLLVACANLCNLFIARSVESKQDFAIHVAMGAKHRQLFNKLFVESALLSFASGIMALLLAIWAIELIKFVGSDALPRLNQLAIDSYTLLFSVIICCVLALFFSYVPFWLSRKASLNQQMQTSGKGGGKQSSSQSRKVLLIGQSLLVSMLLCFSSLFLQKSLAELDKVTGFDTEQRAILTIDSENRTLSKGELASELPAVIEQIRQLPEVTNVALSNASPVKMAGVVFPVQHTVDSAEYMLSVSKVQSNFFTVLGIEFITGSTFDLSDNEARYEVVLNQSSAALLLGENWSIGDNLLIAGRPHTLVGVIKDTFRTRYLRSQLGNELVIVPYNKINGDMLPSEQIVLNIHHGNAEHLNFAHIDAVINATSNTFDIVSLQSFDEILEEEVHLARTTATLALSFCLLTLLLAAIGVWGIVNYSAKMRHFEFGIRMAIGAKKAHLLKMMLLTNIKPLLFGMLMGAVLAISIIQSYSAQFAVFGHLQLNYLIPMMLAMILTTFIAIIKPVSLVVNSAPMNALKREQ